MRRLEEKAIVRIELFTQINRYDKIVHIWVASARLITRYTDFVSLFVGTALGIRYNRLSASFGVYYNTVLIKE